MSDTAKDQPWHPQVGERCGQLRALDCTVARSRAGGLLLMGEEPDQLGFRALFTIAANCPLLEVRRAVAAAAAVCRRSLLPVPMVGQLALPSVALQPIPPQLLQQSAHRGASSLALLPRLLGVVLLAGSMLRHAAF